MNFKKLSFDCVLSTISKKYSKKNAVIFKDQIITYNELYKNSITYANNFLNLQIKKGDKVGILLSNRLEYLYVYFALFIIGACAVPVSIKCTPNQIKNILLNSDVNAIIFEGKVGNIDYNSLLSGFKLDLPLLNNYILLSDRKTINTISFSELLQNNINNKLEIKQSDPDDIAMLAYSSGATGIPKGVLITQKSLILSSIYAGEKWDLQNDICFTVAPFFSAQEFIASLIYIFSGSTMKWISTLNPNDIILELLNKNITMFHSQTPLWKLLLSLPYINSLKFNHLKKVVVFGSLCSYNLAKLIDETFGCTLLNTYSLIEATSIVLNTSPNDSKKILLNTVGQPINGVEIKIVDKNRNSLKKGEIGELAVKGYLMKEYYKNYEKTNKVIGNDGWLYTGDIGYYFDNLNIRILGRLSDIVIRNNLKIYTVNLEKIILDFEKVQDVCVVGYNNNTLNDELAAFIIPKPTAKITIEEVKKFCINKIPEHEIPDNIIFVSQFPILPSGKIQKNILKQWLINGIPEEYLMLFDGKTILSKKKLIYN